MNISNIQSIHINNPAQLHALVTRITETDKIRKLIYILFCDLGTDRRDFIGFPSEYTTLKTTLTVFTKPQVDSSIVKFKNPKRFE